MRLFGHVATEASPEAQEAVEEAERLRDAELAQGKRWEHHLKSNGFAELVANMFENGKR